MITADQKGYKLPDELSIKKQITEALNGPSNGVVLDMQTLSPAVTADTLEPKLASLVKKQKLSITYAYETKKLSLEPAQIAAFYDLNTLQPSPALVTAQINKIGASLGIRVENLTVATNTTLEALSKEENITLMLKAIPKASRAYTYCTAVRSVDASNLSSFNAKVASVLADDRGWTLDGQVSFSRVASGCNFTVWLAAAAELPGFSSACSASWSCRVGANVIINYDRWVGASSAWNQSGGSLDDYRSMVINHEVGHWLGFGHLYCGGSGQLAPVMQQQSIDLQGCRFNPWPTLPEKNTLKSNLGL